tara:strand:- start:2763 stop:3737 length:975 start_codon:yes stop_codon:yes gene_type:complete
MALPSSGPLSLNQIHIEAGGSSGTICTLNDADIRDIISKDAGTTNSISEYRGQSAVEQVTLTSGGTVNGQAQRQQITASSFISTGGILTIPSSMWVWSDNTSVAALTIDISCTVVNNGKIIGKGGNGGYYVGTKATDGGPAIKINSGVSGVTITNASGAYIAGGGGGGGYYQDRSNPSDAHAGGGGGAGGGNGGTGRINQGYWQAGVGGALNASGTDGGNGYQYAGKGGGAGGGHGGQQYGGGGGGRILPGTGGSAGGGSGGNAGTSGSGFLAGGGGGWGAAGADGGGTTGPAYEGGGAGGAAIDPTGNSYTLNNNGTLYGSTT